MHKRELASLYPSVEVHVRKFDAADEKSVKAVVDHAVQTYGRLDIFFANAGIVGQNKLFSDINEDEFLATLRTNVVRYEVQVQYLYRSSADLVEVSSLRQSTQLQQ